MSAALKVLEAANKQHAALWEESGTLARASGTVTVRARINRIAPQPSGLGGEINIQLPRGSTILLPKTITQPRQDEVFTDSAGAQHRLMEDGINLGYAWLCNCDIAISPTST